MALCPDPEDSDEVRTLMDGFYKWAMNMGITWFFRALRRRIDTKNKRGWNRPFVEQIRNITKQSLRNRYPNKMPKGIQLVDKAIDSIMVLADDDDLYYYILRDAIRDIVEANLDIPKGLDRNYSKKLQDKIYEANRNIVVKRE